MTRDEHNRSLLARYRERGDRSALGELVESNLGAIAKAAQRRCREAWRRDPEGVLSEGRFGLLKLAESFDAGRPEEFSAAAYWAVLRQFNRRPIQPPGAPVHIPKDLLRGYWSRSNRRADYRARAESAQRSALSLSLAEHDAGGSIAPLDRRERPGEAIERAELIGALLAALEGMASPRHRRAVELRFGLDGGGERTLAEVAEAVGMSPAWTHRAINGALAVMRSVAAARAVA